jgi:transcriptional regulator with XRE-family HTH domain
LLDACGNEGDAMSEIGGSQLGYRLAQLRERAGLKQAELARQVTWSASVLSRIEAGERSLSDEELKDLLTAIGTREAEELGDILGRRWTVLPAPPLDHADLELLWAAEQVGATLTSLAGDPDIRPAFERRLQEYIDEIKRLASLLMRREHRIAFIGSIGIGKSTAICRATAMEVTALQGRPIPVLETGGGGITLCEVHLTVGPGYGVIVEPRTTDAIRADVADFADLLLRGTGSELESREREEAVRAVPREIERALRNMTGLKPKRTKTSDGKIVRSDPARDLAATIPSARELVVELLARMELHKRDRRDEWYDQSSPVGPLEWMKDMFEQINNGRHSDFSLPARIEMVVPELLEIFDLDIGIVDTRGIDDITARADLEEHLHDPHTVSVLCSGFNDAPAQSVHHLLQRARDISNRQIDSHASVLVLARPGEALAVKDESGVRAESVAEGYELKGEQVGSALSPFGLEALPVGFFNALEDDPKALCEFLSARVSHTRHEFERELSEVLASTTQVLENVELQQVQEVQREAGRHISAWLGHHTTPPDVKGHVQDTLLAEIQSAHASTVRAAVRREGEWRSLSYSHQLGFGARRTAVAALRDWVAGFRDICATLAVSLPEAAELLTQASRLMGQANEELLKKMQVAGVTLYREQLQQDQVLWLELAGEWGRGAGYRDRVAGRQADWFTEQAHIDIEGEILAVLDREWRAVLDRVASIFDRS